MGIGLEDESHALAKRMSAASMGSTEDHHNPPPRSLDSFHTQSNVLYLSSPASSSSRDNFRQQPSSSAASSSSSPPLQYPLQPRPSAIPRPSLQNSRAETPSGGIAGVFTTSANGGNGGARTSRSSSFKRSRTYSQPFPFDIPSASTSPPPPPVPHYQHQISGTGSPGGRSDSPMMGSSIKGTRIPVSRARASSTSSNQFFFNAAASPGNNNINRSESRNGNLSKLSNGYVDSELWPVAETSFQTTASFGSRSTVATMRTPQSGVSELLNEQAPFNPNSASSRNGLWEASYALTGYPGLGNSPAGAPGSSQLNYEYHHAEGQGHAYGEEDQYTPRPNRFSSDSDEKPFEHWYRGDVARNGGVGELRVAKKQEMLDIANYGHTLKQASARLAFGSNGGPGGGAIGGYEGNGSGSGSPYGNHSRSNSRGREVGLGIYHAGAPGSRPRSGSLGANEDRLGEIVRGRVGKGGRESFYLDEEEYEQVGGGMVLDERPLTDLDSDEEVGGGHISGDEGEEYEEYEEVYDDGGGGDEEEEDYPMDRFREEEYEQMGSPSPPSVHSQSYHPQQSQSRTQSRNGNRSDTPSSSAHGGATSTTIATTNGSNFKTRLPTPTSRPLPQGRSSSSETARSNNHSSSNHNGTTPNTGYNSTTPHMQPRTPTPSSSNKLPASKGSMSPGNRSRRPTGASSVTGGQTPGAGGKRAKSPAAGSIKTTPSTGNNHPRTRTPPSAGGRSPKRNGSTPSKVGKKFPPTKKVIVKQKQNGRRKEEEEERRVSVAKYPEIGDGSGDGEGDEGDMAHAIPSWTQPVGKGGNWDDVSIFMLISCQRMILSPFSLLFLVFSFFVGGIR